MIKAIRTFLTFSLEAKSKRPTPQSTIVGSKAQMITVAIGPFTPTLVTFGQSMSSNGSGQSR